MRYRELLTQLRSQGYAIIDTIGLVETIDQHLERVKGDIADIQWAEAPNPDNHCLEIWSDDPHWSPSNLYTIDGYERTHGRDDADRTLHEMGLLLTTTEAASLLSVHRDTTRRAAAGGHVDGAHHAFLPGVLGWVWVATEASWREWNANRHPAGRPVKNRTSNPASAGTSE